MAGAAIVALLALFAAGGPFVARHGPLESDFVHGIADDKMPVGPGREFLLGADRLFRDVFARLAYGGRISLLTAVGATAIAAVLGAIVGIAAGYFEGRPIRVPWAAIAGAAAIVAAASGRPGVAALIVATGVAAFVVRRS